MNWTRLLEITVVFGLLVAAAPGCKQKPEKPTAESETSKVNPPPSAGTTGSSGEAGESGQDEGKETDEKAGDKGSVTLDKKEYKPPEPPSKTEPGPDLGTTYIGVSEVETLEDLARLFPLPDGYEYDRAPWGQPIIRRTEDDVMYSFFVEGRMLTFNHRRETPRGTIAYDTSEVFHADDAADCPKKEWEVEGGGCVTGFANEK